MLGLVVIAFLGLLVLGAVAGLVVLLVFPRMRIIGLVLVGAVAADDCSRFRGAHSLSGVIQGRTSCVPSPADYENRAGKSPIHASGSSTTPAPPRRLRFRLRAVGKKGTVPFSLRKNRASPRVARRGSMPCRGDRATFTA